MKVTNETDNTQKEPLTVEQKLRQKKMLIYPLMFIVFGLCIWYIFSPSKSEKAKETRGFNTTIPMPKNKALPDDKKEAFEQARLEENQNEQKHSLQSLASIFNEEMKSSDVSGLDMKTETKANHAGGNSNSINNRSRRVHIAKIQSSNNAYKQINQNLGNFFNSSKENPEKKQMNRKMEELSAKIQETNSRKSTIADQIELMEKSYQMAAKYIPQGQNKGQTMDGQNYQSTGSTLLSPKKKRQISSINQQIEQTVSSLPQAVDSVGMSNSLKPHNKGFNTAVGTSLLEDRNTIKACVHENCSLVTGQSVRLRLLEPVQVGKTLIPPNTMISGEARIQGDRLNISIQSLEYRGTIIPVDLTVYDIDGQEGIFIPGSLEINAFKEMAGNIGSNMGTSISLTQSAGQQVLSGLGKGVIQSGSQYMTKKVQTINVKLKAGYKVLLLMNQE
ncbi:conjugative transposon protein TraM [Flavobacterium sp. UBA6031]|uniref:conjugative transposon protein TraM n=1 Tax=Flavobacterium sp. UBA6031 TaxID=1946551 RepID=UPI0025C2BBD1|nr:conjugative transposon protein TraM [Flavobacterium sp. UBA6031]